MLEKVWTKLMLDRIILKKKGFPSILRILFIYKDRRIHSKVPLNLHVTCLLRIDISLLMLEFPDKTIFMKVIQEDSAECLITCLIA